MFHLGNFRISIHAPRGGSDRSKLEIEACKKVFQSTLPVGGATGDIRKSDVFMMISIHAPRGGSDSAPPANQPKKIYFNPRSPWGERRLELISYFFDKNFNPRSPWGERRLSADHTDRPWKNFNPRSPWGERLIHPL